MGFLTRAFEQRRVFGQEWLDMISGLSLGTSSGVNITTEGSLKSTAVFACVRVLSESVASLPLHIYERLPNNGGKRKAISHPLYNKIHARPNPEMTSFEFRETLTGHLALWGNAYAEIERDNGNRIRGLWPLRPDQMTVGRSGGSLFYKYRLPDGNEVFLDYTRILHIRGLSPDGILGYSPIAIARQAVGLALATEEFGSRFFSNGARPGMVITHPGVLSKDAKNKVQRSIERTHQGLSNSHRVMVLEEAMQVSEIGIPPEDAQFLETRKFQTSEIARLYRVPPHMIGDLERATFSNVEQQSIDFVTHTLRPWLVRWEQTINKDLVDPKLQNRFFVEFLVDGLLRGDIESRYNAYATGRQNGWLSANDIRAYENQNPIENGDLYLVPLNMIPADQAGQPPNETGRAVRHGEQLNQNRGATIRNSEQIERRAQDMARDRQQLASSYERVIFDTADRVIRRELADVRRGIKKYLEKGDSLQFLTWLKQFYDDHKLFWGRQIQPIIMAYADQIALKIADELAGDPFSADDIGAFIEKYSQDVGIGEASNSHLQLKAIVREATDAAEDPEPLLMTRLDEWEEKRAGKVANFTTFDAFNALAKAFYVASGIITLRWVTTGKNCPYCTSLNGQVVGIHEWFLAKDTEYQPAGADRPINIRYNAGHPPIHGGCDCMIVAEQYTP